MKITNPKVKSILPEWSDFNGFSLLFDNRNSINKKKNNSIHHLNNTIEDNTLSFYKQMYKCLVELGISKLKDDYGFCQLPFPSWHVTFWDGINKYNINNLNKKERLFFNNVFYDYPNSIKKLYSHKFIKELISDVKIEDSIRFEYKKLVKWNNHVLVSHLKPADEDSKNNLEKLVEIRKEISDKFNSNFGFDLYEEYRPHLSLGYFANEDDANQLSSQINTLNDLFLQKMKNEILEFNSIRLFGFNNMSCFFR